MSLPDSPDLDPKLREALLSSLASWDPRASVPLALSFMEHGDPAALEGFTRLMQSSPGAEGMLEARYLSPTPDIDALRSYPEGSLGHAFVEYLDANELDASLLRESAFIPAHKARGNDEGYLAERGFQLHDLFHVLTGYDTSPLGEVKVVSFTVAQAPAPYPAMIIASRPLQMVLYQPELLPFVMDAITEGWARGRKAKPLLPVAWEDHWEVPLAELQAEYGLS
jgi:ubiquinone biosynthesis protein COQ4